MAGELTFGGKLWAAGELGELGPGIVIKIGEREISVVGLSHLEVRAIAANGLDAPVVITIAQNNNNTEGAFSERRA